MEDIYDTWIKKTGVDGFRIDTVKNVDMQFWQQFIPQITPVRQGPRQAGLLHRSARSTRLAGRDVLLRDRRADSRRRWTSRSRTPHAEYVSQGGSAQTLAQLFAADDRLHDRDVRRLRAADLPRQPRHGPHRLLPHRRQPERLGRRAAPARRTGRPAHVPDPRPAGRLLRRRAGLHRRRRRQGRPAGHVRLEDARVRGRQADRHHAHRRDRRVRHLRAALPGDRPALHS